MVVAPLTFVVGGRATRGPDGRSVPVRDVAAEAAREYVLDAATALPADALAVEVRTGEPSADLEAVFESTGVPRANDTSVGVGYAPPSDLETLVRTLEPRVRGVDAVGPDVKVMGGPPRRPGPGHGRGGGR